MGKGGTLPWHRASPASAPLGRHASGRRQAVPVSQSQVWGGSLRACLALFPLWDAVLACMRCSRLLCHSCLQPSSPTAPQLRFASAKPGRLAGAPPAACACGQLLCSPTLPNLHSCGCSVTGGSTAQHTAARGVTGGPASGRTLATAKGTQASSAGGVKTRTSQWRSLPAVLQQLSAP